MTLHNLGILYDKKNNFEPAEKAYLRALKIREGLAIIDKKAYEPDLAFTLFDLGILYVRKNDFEAGEKAYLRTPGNKGTAG